MKSVSSLFRAGNSPIASGSLPAFLLSLLVLSGAACGGGQIAKGKPGQKTALQCSDPDAIRYHFDPADGSIKEKGPVLIPKGVKCSEARDWDEKKLFTLKRTGVWEQYYSKSTDVMSRGEYELNKRVKEWTFFDHKGNRIRTVMYANGDAEGPETAYFPGSDDWRVKGQNHEDKKTGHWVERGSTDSKCLTEGDYKEGKKDGPWKECAKDPETKEWFLSFDGSYQGGLKSGHATTFFPDGKKSSEGNYVADFECQKNPPPQGEEACGKHTGVWTLYHSNGNPAATGSYNPEKGLRSGTWTEYYKSGEKMASGERDHTRRGMWTFWDKGGRILSQLRFEKNDAVPVYAVLYQKGEKEGEGPLMNGLVKYDGEKDDLVFAAFMRRGTWTLYSGGSKVAEGEYVNNQKEGVWKELVNGAWVTKKYGMAGRMEQMDKRMGDMYKKLNVK